MKFVEYASHWREIIDTDKSASEVLARYEKEAGGRSLPVWLRDNDGAAGSGFVGRVDYKAGADSLRADAAAEKGIKL